jgi:hypothetical protein
LVCIRAAGVARSETVRQPILLVATRVRHDVTGSGGQLPARIPSVPRTPVRCTHRVTERPRAALRQPRSLQPEQLGLLPVTTPTVPAPVSAWVLWEDGVEELVPGHAIAWTKRAVHIRFGAPPHQHHVWVWAGAVERA